MPVSRVADTATQVAQEKGVTAMTTNMAPPVYSQIALDVALRIARGELKENTKVYGRSVMASEYGVSPETIRRAMKLLADMEIVSILHNSGAMILSGDKARQYVEKFSAQNDIRTQQKELLQLLKQQEELGKRITDVAGSIVRINEKFSASKPFPHFEATVPADCPLVGKNLSELHFWQQTGATVIALRRQARIVLSPGPYAALEANDIVMFVGNVNCYDAVEALLASK